MGPQLIQQIAVGSINVAGANDIYYRTLCPIQVMQIGFVVSTGIGSAAIIITADIVEADTTVAIPTGAAALGTLTALSSTMAVNLGVWYDVSLRKGRRVVYPGEALRFYCSTTGTGIVQVFALVQMLGFNNADMRSNVTSHPGSTTRTSSFTQLTEVDE